MKEERARHPQGIQQLELAGAPHPQARSEARVFFTGLMFLTRLPCPAWVDHHPCYLMRSLQWFPLIGAAVGAWAAVFLTAAAVLWPPGVAAAVSTLAGVWLTGCFHEDGLADCLDGFGGGWSRREVRVREAPRRQGRGRGAAGAGPGVSSWELRPPACLP